MEAPWSCRSRESRSAYIFDFCVHGNGLWPPSAAHPPPHGNCHNNAFHFFFWHSHSSRASSLPSPLVFLWFLWQQHLFLFPMKDLPIQEWKYQKELTPVPTSNHNGNSRSGKCHSRPELVLWRIWKSEWFLQAGLYIAFLKIWILCPVPLWLFFLFRPISTISKCSFFFNCKEHWLRTCRVPKHVQSVCSQSTDNSRNLRVLSARRAFEVIRCKWTSAESLMFFYKPHH